MVSKSAAALAATGVGGTGAAAVGGAYYLGAFDGTSPEQGLEVPAITKLSQAFRDSIANKQTDDLKCLYDFLAELDAPIRQDLFSTTPLENSKEIEANDTQLTDSFWGSNTTPLNNCMVVHWDKQEGDNGKWHGNLRWLWVFAQGDQVIVTFNVLESSTTSPQLNGFGGIYFINQNAAKNWTIHRYKKWPTSFSISKDNFDQKFPQVGESLPERDKLGNGKDFWGFVTKKEDLNNICLSSGNCQEDQLTTKKTFRGRWQWETQANGDKRPTDWVKNPDTWFVQAYSDIPNLKGIMDKKFQNMKGKWTKQTFTLTPSST